MLFSLHGELRYKELNNECLVYKLGTAETLLLEKRAASFLKKIPDQPSSLKQIKASVTGIDDLDSECLSLGELLNYFVDAGLVKTVA